MDKLLRSVLLIGTTILILAGISWGQASESEMRAFPMPPAQGYMAEKFFSYAGDYGYYLVPENSSPSRGSGDRPSDYERPLHFQPIYGGV